MDPWDGVNALDALICAYNNISMLRQQLRPEEKVHGCILESPKVSNVVPEFTKISFSVRSPTEDGVVKLGTRLEKCIESAGIATGSSINIAKYATFSDLPSITNRVRGSRNIPICGSTSLFVSCFSRTCFATEKMYC